MEDIEIIRALLKNKYNDTKSNDTMLDDGIEDIRRRIKDVNHIVDKEAYPEIIQHKKLEEIPIKNPIKMSKVEKIVYYNRQLNNRMNKIKLEEEKKMNEQLANIANSNKKMLFLH